MKSIFKILLLFILAFSCKTENKALKKDTMPFKRNFKVTDTIKLSGFIIFNSKSSVQQFYQEKEVFNRDTINFIRELNKTNGNYSFVQPYDLKKYGLYYNFCKNNDEEGQKFIKNIKIRGELVWIYVDRENFIVLEDENDKKLITFICWKPFVGGINQ